MDVFALLAWIGVILGSLYLVGIALGVLAFVGVLLFWAWAVWGDSKFRKNRKRPF